MTPPAVMLPARPQLAQARRVVCPPCPACGGGGFVGAGSGYGDVCDECAGVGDDPMVDPAEAWEALAARGVIPLAWVGDEWRWFLGPSCDACGARGSVPGGYYGTTTCKGCDGEGALIRFPHPPTVVAAVALASDPRGVETAEALALDACGRFALWGAPSPERVVWRVAPAAAWDPPRWSTDPKWEFLLRASHATPPAPSSEQAAWVGPGLAAPSYALQFAAAVASERCDWNHAAVRDVAVVATTRSQRHAGRPLREFANPWAPLGDMLALGYGIDAVTDDAVVLVCPEPGRSADANHATDQENP